MSINIIDANDKQQLADDLQDEYGDHQNEVMIMPESNEIASGDVESIKLYQCDNVNYIPSTNPDGPDNNLVTIN